MSGIVGDVLSWAQLAVKVKRLVEVCRGRSAHLAEFSTYLATVGGLLEQVDKETSGLPECADLLRNEQKYITEAVAKCEHWATEHTFLHAPADKKAADGIHAQIEASVKVLQLGIDVFALKKIEVSARKHADELAEDVQSLDSYTRKELMAARAERQEARIAADRKAEHWARLAEKGRCELDEMSAERMRKFHGEQLAQHSFTQALVMEGRKEVKDGFLRNTAEHGIAQEMLKEVLAFLKPWDERFKSVAKAGAKLHEIAAQGVASDYGAELTGLETEVANIAAPNARIELQRHLDLCRSALERAQKSPNDVSEALVQAMKERFSALRRAVQDARHLAPGAPLGAAGTYVAPPELDEVVRYLRSRSTAGDGLAPRPVWLHGAPGLGKSALCRALHDRYHTTDQPDEGLRSAYPDGVILVSWGPSGIAPRGNADAVQREDQNRTAARWLGELQKADIGLAVLLGCVVAAGPQAASEKAPPAADLLRQLCRQVQRTLRQRKLLLIIDDVWSEDFALFESDWLGIDTLHGGSACVITSRDAGRAVTGGNYEAMELRPVDDPSAQRILLQAARMKTTASGDVPSGVQDLIDGLVAKCGGHALTLVLVAGAVKRDAVLHKRDEPGAAQWKSVLDDMTALSTQTPSDYNREPMCAYELSVTRQSELGKSILATLCVFPAVQSAPAEMVRDIWLANRRGLWHLFRCAWHVVHALQRGTFWPARLGDSAADFKAGLQALAFAHIVDLHTSDSGGEELSFHLLLGDYLKSAQRPLTPYTLPRTGLQNSARVVYALLSICSAGHQKMAMIGLEEQLTAPNAAETLAAASETLLALARSDAALTAMEHAHDIFRSELGDRHPRAAKALSGVGLCLGQLGRHQDALQRQQLALDIRRAAFKDPHPQIAASLRTVGATLAELGRYEEALEHQQQGLRIAKDTFGGSHPNTAAMLNDVGRTLGALGLHRKALELEEEALRIVTSTFGDQHCDVGVGLNAVARTMSALGRYSEALQRLQQALAIFTDTWGEGHPNTSASLVFMGGVLWAMARYDEAFHYQQQALNNHRTTFGEGHPITGALLCSIGGSLWAMGRYGEALQHQQRALSIHRAAFGDGHPGAADALCSIGSTLWAMGRYEAALQHLQQALAIHRAALSDKHPDAAALLCSMGLTLLSLERKNEALQHQEEALAICKSAFGDKHPAVAMPLNNGGGALRALGRHEEALKWQEEALTIRKSALGEDHPYTAWSLNDAGCTLREIGRLDEARQLQEQALTIRKSTLGPEHPETAMSYSDLGDTLQELGRHEEALGQHQQALAIRKSKLGDEHPGTVASMKSVSALQRQLECREGGGMTGT